MTKYEELAIQSPKAVEHQADWLDRLAPVVRKRLCRDCAKNPAKIRNENRDPLRCRRCGRLLRWQDERDEHYGAK
jgi:hypothetical protein